ncbi:quorum-sensing phosphorelay protein LuxU [Vibrio alfacsensis]|uniref:quorum-sensing phosphorelay protein LuxU n=1 Tax=Vibrio alfacsensis TaxID=1074311 RepID=UPI004067D14F
MTMDVLNQNKIQELANEIGKDNVPILLEIFLGEMDSYMVNLSQHHGAAQLVYLKDISHALKSSAASFGADRLCDFATSIDSKAKVEKLVENGEEVDMMLELLHITRDVYRAWTF